MRRWRSKHRTALSQYRRSVAMMPRERKSQQPTPGPNTQNDSRSESNDVMWVDYIHKIGHQKPWLLFLAFFHFPGNFFSSFGIPHPTSFPEISWGFFHVHPILFHIFPSNLTLRPCPWTPNRAIQVVVGFDSSEEPTPIRLVPKGKMLAEGEVYETQSEEIRCWGRVETEISEILRWF